MKKVLITRRLIRESEDKASKLFDAKFNTNDELYSQKKIIEILYPHKPGSKNFKLWKKYYTGATGLLSIVIKSKNKSSVIKFVNSLELFGIGYSWGGFESLAILQELKPSKDEYSQGRRFFKYKKNEHIVRLHIGLEDPKDLITDLKQSLRYIR